MQQQNCSKVASIHDIKPPVVGPDVLEDPALPLDQIHEAFAKAAAAAATAAAVAGGAGFEGAPGPDGPLQAPGGDGDSLKVEGVGGGGGGTGDGCGEAQLPTHLRRGVERPPGQVKGGTGTATP